MKQATIRKIHRDLGYFYIGLIISFSLSGILMNHRDSWHPEKYTIETKVINIKLLTENKLTESFADSLGKTLGIDDKMRRNKVVDGKFKISFEKHDIEIDLKSGKGEMISYLKTPVINQMMKLHKNTSNWWIYYGDIFGISLMVIAITGALMIPAGKFNFKQRGWKLALAGILFPLLFLFLLS